MPDWKAEILRRLAPLKLAPMREAEIAEEIAQHLDDRYQELLASGQSEDAAFRTSLDELKGEDLLARDESPEAAQRAALGELRGENLLARGKSEDKARPAALEEHDGEDLLAAGLKRAEKNFYREPIALGKDSSNFLSGIVQDVRFALRMLGKSPGFTAVAILTLALGIGANTAIFSLIDGILMRALPVRDAQSLVVLRWSALHSPEIHNWIENGDCNITTGSKQAESSSCSFSEPFFHDIASHIDAFSDVAAFSSEGELTWGGVGAVRILNAQTVSGTFFPTLGVTPAAGRLIQPSDDTASAPPVLVLNYSYWKNQLGGSLSIIGKTVSLNNVPFTIIGVANPQFNSLTPGEVRDIWIPFSVLSRLYPDSGQKPRETDVYAWWVVIIGRLKRGVPRVQAQAAVSAFFHNEMLHGAKPLSKPSDDPRVAALPAQSALTGSKTRYSAELYILMGAVGIVLLIACANVAGLLLSRAEARRKEIAIRLALGAGRRRIVRQLLTESVLLAVIGGALGILFAVWGTQSIVSLMAGGSASAFGFAPGIDGRVLAVTLLASVLTGILFGLAPAARGTRIELTQSLKESSGGSPTRRRAGKWLSLGDSLVIGQVGLAVVVLIGAGLLVRTLENLKNLDPGFDTRNLLTFGINPPLMGYKTPQAIEFYKDLQERIGALPGVNSVSYASNALLSGSLSGTSVHLHGTPKEWRFPTDDLRIGPNYFSTMHMRLLAGRSFTSADFARREAAAESAAVQARQAGGASQPGSAGKRAVKSEPLVQEELVPAIVNKAFVSKYLAHKNPLGQRLDEGPGYVIVGVISDAKYSNLRDAIGPTMYIPSDGSWGVSFEVRTSTNPAAMAETIRKIVSQMDSNLGIFDVYTETQLIDQLLVRERMIARLSGFFGVLALALACIGLYGLLSYEVSRRTREIGVRMALGAQQRDVLRLVVGRGILLAIVGAAVGIGVALAVTRYLASLLYGVHADDPVTIIGVAVLLALVALAACYIPASRAMRVDPMVALRYE
ncbi:MAG TPA: ABC transporter permease [Candidatus Acidoferrales bacterium]|nr:ABC transporter permease [Candidatus Acidoferrales bacterium]